MVEGIPLPSVFISVGHLLSPVQQQLLSQVDALLVKHGKHSVTIGRPTLQQQPLTLIRDIITETQGTIAIAFVRLKVSVGTEYPGTDFAQHIAPRSLPTVWNQIEAAMTLQAQHPLLILCEEGVTPAGIIDPAIFPVVPFSLNLTSHSLSDSIVSAMCIWLQQLLP